MSLVSGRRYKDYKIYSCFVLNLLVKALDINLYQNDLERQVDDILAGNRPRVTKEDVRHEIHSNHKMTNKILDYLENEGYIALEQVERSYNITITKEGVLHIREFNRFYGSIYERQIRDHYKYRGLPQWFLELEKK